MESNYTWSQFDEDCEELLRRIKNKKFKPSTIVALARGGLCLGVKLSHALGKPLMIVSAKTYGENKRSLQTVLLNSSYTVPLKSPVLILDEIADSGKTLKIVVDHFSTLGVDIKTATLLYKPHSIVRPDFYCKVAENKQWITFPWEME